MPIIGTCIKDGCDEPIPMFSETDDGRIAYVPHTCDACGTKMWTVVSRVDPRSFHEKDFLELFDVNLQERSVEPKAGVDSYGNKTT
jgi:hypothetical protein